MKLELFKGDDGWRLRLRARNGRILVVSEAYFSRFNARRAARKNFPDITVVEL